MGSDPSATIGRICGACGTENSSGSRFCRGCGVALPEISVCSGCGGRMAVGAQFCPACGTPTGAAASGADTESAPSSPVCGACGTPCAPAATFCRRCGSPLGMPVAPVSGVPFAIPIGTGGASVYAARRSYRLPIIVAVLAVAALLVVLFIAGAIPGLSNEKKSQPAAVAATTQATVQPGAPSATASAAPRKATPNPLWAKITPEDLLAAAFTRSEVEQIVNKPGDQWWAGTPRFGGAPLPDPDFKGERFYANQPFDRTNGPEWLYIDLSLFPDATTASDCFSSLLSTADKGATMLSGSAIADEQRYFTFTNPGADAPNESDVRLRVGPVIALISWGDRSGFQTPATMARFAAALVPKLNSLLAGKLTAPVVRPELIALLPTAVPSVGPILGTAALPPEAWNYRDDSGKLVQGTLYLQGGVTQLAFRRYSLAADANQVVEVTLHPFKDAASAQAYMANQIKLEPTVTQRKLDPGKTGQVSGYFLSKDDTYWLEFAVGAYSADVECFSPHSDVSSACEAAVRQVGEAWYTKLSTAAPLGH